MYSVLCAQSNRLVFSLLVVRLDRMGIYFDDIQRIMTVACYMRMLVQRLGWQGDCKYI